MRFRPMLTAFLLVSQPVLADCPTPVLVQGAPLSATPGPRGLAVADFNKDGKNDYVVAGIPGNGVIVYLGIGDGTFAAGVPYASLGTNPSAVAAADLNGDTYPDLAVANETEKTVAILLNDGDGTFGTAVPYLTNSSFPNRLLVGRFNDDTAPDLLLSGFAVKILYGAGDGTISSIITVAVPGSPLSASAGDLDEDGIDEVVVLFDDYVQVPHGLAIYADGPLYLPTIKNGLPSQGGNERSLAVDLNNDGAADVITVHHYAKKVLVFMNDGTGTLGAPVTYALPQEPSAVATDDISGDGIPDLVFATWNSTATPVMYGNGDGTFREPVFRVIDYTDMFAVATGDINGDATVDVLLADATRNSIQVLNNYCPAKTVSLSVTSNKSSSIYSETVIFTATVTPSDGGNVSGKVLFYDGSQYLTAITLEGTPRQAKLFSSPFLAPLEEGEHVITAQFEGSAEYQPAEATINHTVVRLPFGPPQYLAAAGNGTDAVYLSWLPTDDSASFEILRMSGGTWSVAGTTTASSYIDSRPQRGAYFYRVRAFRTGTSAPSAYTPAEPAIVDASIAPPEPGDVIRTFHWYLLRDMARALRIAAGLPFIFYTDENLDVGVPIKAVHMNEIRNALTSAMTAAGGTVPTFSPITPGVTVVTANDYVQLYRLMQ